MYFSSKGAYGKVTYRAPEYQLLIHTLIQILIIRIEKIRPDCRTHGDVIISSALF